jgi:hypothetical protein
MEEPLMADDLITTTEIESMGEAGYIGYWTHNPARPHDQQTGSQVKTGKISVVREKTSVESGVFIPGQYRVNPYSVKGGTCSVRNDAQGALYLNQDFIPGAANWPGIHPSHAALIDEDTPVYAVGIPFVDTYWASYGGYVPGETYYQSVYVFGDWWRFALPNYASDETIPHEAEDYEQLSLQKAYAKLGSADLELGESIGEYRETIEMLRHPLSQLKKFLIDDHSRNWRLLTALAKSDKRAINRLLGRTGLATADTVTGTWLEIRYGLRPLVSLIQDVVEMIKEQQKEILDPEKIRSARSRLMFGPIQTWVEPYVTYGNVAFIRSRCLVEDTYWSTASVQYTQSETNTLLDQLGLSPRFLPEVAWELTRLSFVVDWILSVGPWLGTLRINPGIEVLGNTSGFKHKRKVTVFNTQMCTVGRSWSVPWTNVPFVHDPNGDVAIEQETYERKVNLDLSYLPQFTWGRTLDLFKAIDSISLLWQFAKQLK